MSFNYEEWKQAQFGAIQQEQHSAVIAFPPTVTWAGMIWATIGAITLLCVLVLSSQTGTMRSPGSGLAGLLFLYGGIRAASGTAPGTLRSGIASIVLGAIWVAAGLMITPYAPGRSEMVLLVSCGLGGAMILAGILAAMANPSYQKWRAAQAARSSHSPYQ